MPGAGAAVRACRAAEIPKADRRVALGWPGERGGRAIAASRSGAHSPRKKAKSAKSLFGKAGGGNEAVQQDA